MQELQPPTQLWKPVWSIKSTLGNVQIALEHKEITFERIRGSNLTAFFLISNMFGSPEIVDFVGFQALKIQ